MPIIDFTNVKRVFHTGSESPVFPVEINKVYEGTAVVWEKPVDNKSIPLYIELINSSDTVPLQIIASGYTSKTLAYSYDNQNWTGYTATPNPFTIILNSSNPRVYFRATTNARWNASNTIYWYFKKYATASDVPLRVGGNIFSLENTGTSYQTVISPRDTYSFYRLFQNFTCLTDASNLFLGESGSILTNYCYAVMFTGCTSLTSAPKLPATTLAQSCYEIMFSGCTSLTQAPELPATVLVAICYNAMFRGCTSLTQAPDLPATTLTNMCYYRMFYNCTSLNSIKCLATDISATNCLSDWVSGVSATGTFTKPSSVTWPTGTSGIPSDWTVENI